MIHVPSTSRPVRCTIITMIAVLCAAALLAGRPIAAHAADTDAKPVATKDAKTDKANTAATDAGAKPTAGAAKKPGGKDPAAAILSEAVEKLTAEYKATQKKEGASAAGSLRTTSDYFKDGAPTELTPEKVLAAVAKSYGSDPTLDAYVRWQLLSAIPTTIDDKLLSKGLSAYRSAPRPHARVGASPDERKRLDQAIKGDRVDVAAMNAKFTEAVQKKAALNEPIYGFRDELFTKLPASGETFVAGLGDALDRFHAGDDMGGNAQLKAVGQRVTLWAVSSDNARQKAMVADAVERLRKEPGVEYASELEETNNGQRRWKLATARPDKGELDNIIDILKGAAAFDTGTPEKGKKKKQKQ